MNITTGGGQGMTLEQRLAPAAKFKPEVASLNMGSMNFGLYPMLNRFRNSSEWERAHLEGSRDAVFRKPSRPRAWLTTLGSAGTRFEFECYDTSHLYNLHHFLERGGGCSRRCSCRRCSAFLAASARTRGRDAHETHGRPAVRRPVSLVGAGRRPLPMQIAAMSAAMGGNVRFGLEDSLWAGPGRLAASNAEQCAPRAQDHRGLNLDVATPDEARGNPWSQGRRQVDSRRA